MKLPFIFADDTKCLHAAKTNTDFTAIQEDLNMACNWSKECSLSFNCSKSAVIHFWCNHETPAKYLLNNDYIETRDSIKDLGVMITSNLSWSNHCNMITAKAYKQLGLIRRSFTTNCVSAKKQLYISLVQSQLFYCSQIWQPCLIQDILLLERVQRRATKYILNDYTSSYCARLLKLSMLPVMYIFELNDLLFFIKSIKNPSPHFDITKWIHLSSGVTRSSSHLKLAHKYIKYNSSRHFYFNRLPHLWNSFPPINLEFSTATLKHQLINTFWSIFSSNFDNNNYCTYHVMCPCASCNLTPTTPLFN